MKSNLKLELGRKILANSNLIICSIVRDCEMNLKKNIKTINELCDLTSNSQVIIFENDSKDKTKDILQKWSSERSNIHIDLRDLKNGKTIPHHTNGSVNPYYSRSRIEKMANYRNQYIDYIKKFNIIGDYLIVVDLDVASIDLNGVIDSFGQEIEWDAICANGYSKSPKLSKRYHDTYALVELGKQHESQTEKTIKENQYKFSFLNKQNELFRVFSAYGGLTIYKFELVRNLRYVVTPNYDPNVEVRCEHVGFNSQMYQNRECFFFINPNMKIKYQNIDLNLIMKFITRWMKNSSKFFTLKMDTQ